MKKALPIILLIALALLALYLNNRDQQTTTDNNTEAEYNGRGFNRHPAKINYSKHARCRMNCRHIDETEVRDIIEHGKINYSKSELKGDDCHKKYAVEGYSKDNQHLRIIAAPCNDEETIVTVIDLGKEWVCDCE